MATDDKPFTVIGDTEALTGVAGLPFVPAIRIPAGADLIFVSGVLGGPKNPGDPTDLRAELHRLFRNLEQVLNLSGATIADVVNVNKFLVDIDRDNAVVVEVMREYFERMPTSTTVEVTRLVPGDLRVEVSAIAAVRPA
ncbi:Rid family hydrolase [Amycolatopsis rhabdoformis]|uniref:Rid family hydrolase n=1 Tax=Amycolatopsis rhabdoformis TaxID=1448059 RepID=A0ABZ1IKL8_9PSEU|nr:Rid family hydrolase [Amycolatopsis rhabdoformis]WSE34159.1 Rid family hydrolase [Amycolatopsis rhabdoformis]